MDSVQTNSSEVKDNDVRLPHFFDAHPELKAHMVSYLQTLSREEKQKNLEQYLRFVNGDITWGEIRGITKRMQREVARVAFLKFKQQDYPKAERLFTGLSVIDHTNWYFRAALGAVFQKQKRFDQAVNEYDIALQLKEGEVSCLVNRAECHLVLNNLAAAKKDLETVTGLKMPGTNPWIMRAKLLGRRLEMMNAEVKE